jgi:peptide/nickel transport system substrate-binding protein
MLPRRFEMRKSFIFLILLFCISGMVFSGGKKEKASAATTAETTTVDKSVLVTPKIPKSWYEPPKLASQLGIKDFKQSPMLDARVKSGELPPVKDRLPKDPPVCEPYSGTGKYGGTANLSGLRLEFNWSNLRMLTTRFAAGLLTPDGSKVVPYLIKGWKYSDDYKKLTLYLYEGMKWSDGKPFTADDFIYTWKHVVNNKTLMPTPPDKWSTPLLDVVKENDYTVTYHYGKSVPREADWIFVDSMGIVPGINSISAAEFEKQLHPDFTPMDQIMKHVKEAGLATWDQYYWRIHNESLDHPEYKHVRPTVQPYIPVEITETYLLMERNPYFPYVDIEGRQLPYIDRIRVNRVTDNEMAVAQVISGNSTLEARHVIGDQIPLFKENEQKGNYKTYIFSDLSGSKAALACNLSHKDLAMRKIFQDKRFRIALSLAINRSEINERVYFGQATPTQATVCRLNKFFEERFSKAYAEYDPAKAKSILDEIGLKDVNNDGFRERPDGATFRPEFIYAPADFDPTRVLEMVQQYWKDIGINVDVKLLDRDFHDSKRAANNWDMGIMTMNQVSDLSFGHAGSLAYGWAPHPEGSRTWGAWPGFMSWYGTGGKEGVEPPDEIKKVMEYVEILRHGLDPAERDAAGKKIVEAQAENLWEIGICFETPLPIVVSNKLHNVPEKGVWDWGTRYMQPYRPFQFYMEE